MALPFVTLAGDVAGPHKVSPAEVDNLARRVSAKYKGGALAVTLPRMTIRQAVDWEPDAKRRNFRYRSGIVELKLSQAIYIVNDLSDCSEGEWLVHERLHVDDNKKVMGGIKSELEKDGVLVGYFDSSKWHPLGDFKDTKNDIERRAREMFQKLVASAVDKRDPAGYKEVRDAILAKCGPEDPYFRKEKEAR